MSKVFRQALVDQIVTIDPERGIRRNDIGPAPGRDMLRMGLADLVERDDETFLELTDLGRGVRELALELKEAFAVCDRMRESVVQGIAAVREARGHIAAAAEPRRLDPVQQSRGPTCGTGNHNSFTTFIASLNEAGLNRWKDPAFTGQGPPRSAQPQAQE